MATDKQITGMKGVYLVAAELSNFPLTILDNSSHR